jgi:hypothetical protein
MISCSWPKRTVVLLLALVAGCASAPKSAPDEAAAATPPKRFVVSDDLARFVYADTLDDGRLALFVERARSEEARQLLAVAPGTIVIVPPGRVRNPTGVALRVLEGAAPSLVPTEREGRYAEPVPLSDVVGDVSTDLQAKTDLSTDFSGALVFRDDDTVLRIKRGRVDSRPDASVGLQMRSRKIEAVRFMVQGAFDADLELELVTKGTPAREVTTTLFERYRVLGSRVVGGVPVFETVRVSLDLACTIDASTALAATGGAHAHEPLAIGARYANGSWTNVSEIAAPDMKPIAPVLKVQRPSAFSCALTPRFQLFVYNVVGPALSGATSTTLTMTRAPDSKIGPAMDWKLDGALTADLGLDPSARLPGFQRLETLSSSGLEKTKLALFEKKFRLGGGTVPLGD